LLSWIKTETDWPNYELVACRDGRGRCGDGSSDPADSLSDQTAAAIMTVTPLRIIGGSCVVALYFLVAFGLKANDPVVLTPKVDGMIVQLHKPFVSHGSRFIAPDYWFGSVADSITDLCRSTIMIYEDNQPLGPMHSSQHDILTKGNGRAVHWRLSDNQAIYSAKTAFIFSSSDNTNPKTNGRAYWAVKPNIDAITCPGI
jgi:hypothetical protein